jgi:CheY-like chemotaxis protein
VTRPTILVVDDHPAALEALAAPLRERYAVRTAGTVAAALAALAGVSCVVLDLLLDAPATELHRALHDTRTPVVVVSGLESTAAQQVAAVWGWPALEKPVSPEPLLAAVEAALETRPMPDTSPDASGERTTMAPPPALPAPPPVPADADSSPPIAQTDARVAVVDLLSRRILRGLCSLAIVGLTVWGDRTGHPVDGVTVTALALLGMGASAAVNAVRKRPGATAAGVAGLLALAVAGDAGQLGELGTMAAVGVAGATALVDRAVRS